METVRHSALRLLTLLMTIALADIAVGAAQRPTAVSARPCRVVNATQGKHFPPDSGEGFAAAIASANPDDQLEITGICTGTYTLSQNIGLTGVSTKQFPIPTLDGGQAGSTLTVPSGVTATLTNLTITVFLVAERSINSELSALPSRPEQTADLQPSAGSRPLVF